MEELPAVFVQVNDTLGKLLVANRVIDGTVHVKLAESEGNITLAVSDDGIGGGGDGGKGSAAVAGTPNSGGGGGGGGTAAAGGSGIVIVRYQFG